jgi:hypothetical protein
LHFVLLRQKLLARIIAGTAGRTCLLLLCELLAGKNTVSSAAAGAAFWDSDGAECCVEDVVFDVDFSDVDRCEKTALLSMEGA